MDYNKPGINYPLIGAVLLLVVVAALAASLVITRRFKKAIESFAADKNAQIAALEARLRKSQSDHAALLELTEPTDSKKLAVIPGGRSDPDDEPAA